MSYAQQHRSRAELHHGGGAGQSSLEGYVAAAARTPVRLQHTVVDTRHQHQLPRSVASALEAHDGSATRYTKPHSASGAGVTAWSETASSVGELRHPFQLLQHTPKHAAPPRLKASRKQFVSPHSSVTTADAATPVHAAPSHQPAVVVGGPLATELRSTRSTHDRAPQPNEGNDVSSLGEFSPLPHPAFAASSATSSARLSSSQWPASDTFAARLRNIMETRQQIEALVQKQREDEEEMIHAIANLDESLQGRSNTRSPRHQDGADRPPYEQVLMERAAAFAALRQFKEKGNVIVHKLYTTVKTQQEQALELAATVEALKKANKRLKDAVGNHGGGGGGTRVAAAVVEGNGDGAPDAVAELEEKVATQRRVIEQMDQLMQNADRMLLAMRARVEAAERRNGGASADRRQLPPLPLIPSSAASSTSSPRGLPPGENVATADAAAAMERLSARYVNDTDVAIVAAQQHLLLNRTAELRQALKLEQAQRLHLEEVYGATSEETARNVALLEERLQRAQHLRGAAALMGTGEGHASATTASALREELRALLDGSLVSEDGRGATAAEEAGEELRHADAEPHTMSQASSRSSSTPTRTLFTAISAGDVATQTVLAAVTTSVAGEEEDDDDDEKALDVKDSRSGSAEPAIQSRGETPAVQQVQRPRAYLGGRRSTAGGTDTDGDGVAAALRPLLGIPVPDAALLGASTRRSFNSRSSSASRRLVDFRPATAGDATSRGLNSGSDDDADEEEEELRTVTEARGTSQSRDQDVRTTTPTAIHSPSSPLPDTTTAAGQSVVRQQRLSRQLEELDKIEAAMSTLL
ncbi:hypothetical protein NESM_000386600 [Novymonas esmeraldas]|uniref:Uncharacterized protein n=1 Tax=Novymonas esmeraldas TaxID=1808958 RepID=A0AAW0EM48_9TRYP